MKLLCILLIVLDLIVLCKVLESKSVPTARKVVNIKERPRRASVPFVAVEEEVEEEVNLEELKLRFTERCRAWERQYLWDKEEVVRTFRIKHGIETKPTVYNINSNLFSLKTV